MTRLRRTIVALVLAGASCDGTPRLAPSAAPAIGPLDPPAAPPLPDGDVWTVRVAAASAGDASPADIPAAGEPLAGALVQAWRVPADEGLLAARIRRDGLPAAPDATAHCDASGVARVALPAASGVHWLVIVQFARRRGWSAVVASAAEAPARVELADAATGRVVVVTRDGRPAPGAAVVVSDPFAAPHFAGVTGADGTIDDVPFRCAPADPRGGDRILAMAPGLVGETDETDETDEADRTAIVVLRPRVHFAGRILGPGGDPVPGARVTDIDGSADVTDAGGRFRLDATLGWTPGTRAELDVTADGLRPATMHAVPGDERIEFTLRPEATVRVFGRVEMPDGSPPPVARVEGEAAGSGGVFDIDVDPGTSRVVAEGDWFPGAPSQVLARTGSVAVEAGADDTAGPVRIVLTEERSVLHARCPSSRFAVWFRDRAGWRWMVPDDDSGEVRTVVDLEPGAEAETVLSAGIARGVERLTRTTIRTRGTWEGAAEAIDVPGEATSSAPGDDDEPGPDDGPRGSVRGRLVLAPDDPSLPARVRPPATIVAIVTAGLDAELATVECRPGEPFEIEDVPAGRHRILVLGDGWRAASEIDVNPSETSDAGELVAVPPRRVTGRVTDLDGHPLGGAVVAWNVAGDTHGEETVTRGDGSFEFAVGAFRAGHLVTTRPAFGEDVRGWHELRDGMEIRLGLAATLRLTGLPGAWCNEVRVVSVSGRTALSIPEPAADGLSWVVSDLPAGHVRIEAPGRPSCEADLRPGAVTDVRIPDPAR